MAVKISVVVPVYNGSLYLAEALTSILSQTVPVSEIIVVDDGSTDNSFEIASSFGEKVHSIKHSHSGAAAARNRAIEECTGDYLSFLDADDFWSQNKLEKQLSVLDQTKVPTAVFCHMQQFTSPDCLSPDAIDTQRQVLTGVSICTMLIRREDFIRVGNFSVEFELGEFIEWFNRAESCGIKSHMLDEILACRRIHNTNQGIVKREQRSSYAQIAKAVLDRKRAQSEIKSEIEKGLGSKS